MALLNVYIFHVIHVYIFSNVYYCKRRYFRAAKFSRIKPYGVYSRVLIFAHMPVNSICSIMIIIFTHIKFSCIYGPARNVRKYVPRDNFYVYSITPTGGGGGSLPTGTSVI